MLKEEERILESVVEKKGILDLYILIYRYLKYLNFLFLVFDLFWNFYLFFFFLVLMGVVELVKGI